MCDEPRSKPKSGDGLTGRYIVTNDEWLEIIEWVDARFPRGWTPDQAVAYFDDLHQHLAEDVWDGLYRLYDRGLEFPPNGSLMRKEVAEVVRARMERAKWDAQGLPAPGKEPMGWSDWWERLGLPEDMTEAVRGAHRRIYPNGCQFTGCDVCGNVLTA